MKTLIAFIFVLSPPFNHAYAEAIPASQLTRHLQSSDNSTLKIERSYVKKRHTAVKLSWKRYSIQYRMAYAVTIDISGINKDRQSEFIDSLKKNTRHSLYRYTPHSDTTIPNPDEMIFAVASGYRHPTTIKEAEAFFIQMDYLIRQMLADATIQDAVSVGQGSYEGPKF